MDKKSQLEVGVAKVPSVPEKKKLKSIERNPYGYKQSSICFRPLQKCLGDNMEFIVGSSSLPQSKTYLKTSGVPYWCN